MCLVAEKVSLERLQEVGVITEMFQFTVVRRGYDIPRHVTLETTKPRIARIADVPRRQVQFQVIGCCSPGGTTLPDTSIESECGDCALMVHC